MKRSVLRACLLAAAAMPLASSCANLLGVSDYRVAGTDAGNGIEYSDARCSACMPAQCHAEQVECERDAACARYARCALGCDKTDGGCLFQCSQPLQGTGSPAAKRLVGCEIRKCASECLSCGAPFSSEAPGCASCAIADTASGGLCDVTAKCLGQAGCNGYVACLAEECRAIGTPDPECRLTCGGRYPQEARDFYLSVGIPYATRCTSECAVGRKWDCEPGLWPPRSGGSVKITLQLPGFLPADASAMRVHVRACAGSDFACDKPLDDREPDSDGRVTFEFVPTTDPADHYYEIHQAPTDGTAPYMIYSPWQPPVGDITLWVPGAPYPLSALDSPSARRGAVRDEVALGTVFAVVDDCLGVTADFAGGPPEVTVTASSGGPAYYGVPPDDSAQGGGNASFINVPPGSVSIAVRHGTDHIATAVVPVRAGVVTYVQFNYPPL